MAINARRSVLPRAIGNRCIMVLIVAAFCGAASLRGQTVEMCPDFQMLLQGDTSIRYFKIGFSNIFYANEKPIAGWVYYEGSIQSNTFWIRNCTNSPSQPAIIMPGWLVGMSYGDFWSYSNDKVTTSPRDSKMPSPVEERAAQIRRILRQALVLGSPILPGSVKYKPDGSFEAKLDNKDKTSLISGHFDLAADGRPQRCEFKGDNWQDARLVASYEYAGESCIPTMISVDSFSLLKRMNTLGYKILACELGELPVSSQGYTIDTLTNLGGINLRLRDQMGTAVFRDGAIYNMDKSGRLRLVNKDWGKAPQPGSVSARRKYVLLVLLLPTVPILWLIARTIGRKAKRAKTN